MCTDQEIRTEKHPRPCTGSVVSHKFINYHEHFDLEVSIFKVLFSLFVKMEVSYKVWEKAWDFRASY